MNAEFEATLAEAECELEATLRWIFDELETRTLPAAVVESIYSCALAEDGSTLLVTCDMADGTTAMISVCPGRQITAHVGA